MAMTLVSATAAYAVAGVIPDGAATPVAIPEPGLVLLFGLGLLAVARLRRRRSKPASER
jgi:hypothetical protein